MTDTLNLYALGVFYNRSDAVTYLAYLKENGLNDAYIINQYDLENDSEMNITESAVGKSSLTRKVFTIQLKATRTPLNIGVVFPGYQGVKEMVADDGLYKYTYGEYPTIAKAKDVLVEVKKDFADAFIREINVLINN